MDLGVTSILSDRWCLPNKSDIGSDLNTYTRVILSADKRGGGGYRQRETSRVADEEKTIS